MVAAVVLVCTCGVGAIFFAANRADLDALSGDRDSAGQSAPAGNPAPTGSADTACKVSARPEAANKTIRTPAFASARRSGPATMTISTGLGSIVIDMDRAKTPCTVASFEFLAGQNFFDGTSCHRLVDEGIFVLQCGDPLGDGTGGPDYHFADENLTGARYDRGVVAMANAGPDTNGSQFFIMFRNSPDLPAQYTVFGQVRTGMEVVDKVAAGGHDNAFSGVGGGRPKVPLKFDRVTVS